MKLVGKFTRAGDHFDFTLRMSDKEYPMQLFASGFRFVSVEPSLGEQSALADWQDEPENETTIDLLQSELRISS